MGRPSTENVARRTVRSVLAAVGFGICASCAVQHISLASPEPAQQCAIRPTHLALPLSQPDSIESADDDVRFPCPAGQHDEWSRMPGGSRDLLVSTEGPEGSGRYWTIAIGVASQGEVSPATTVCVTTSTIGWRSLRNFEGRALPWLDDVNGDGRAEAILWESFPLADEPVPPALGLVAWVYEVTPDGNLSIDWDLSRQMARRVAAAYAMPVDRDDPTLRKYRNLAGRALLRFGEGICRAPGEPAASEG